LGRELRDRVIQSYEGLSLLTLLQELDIREKYADFVEQLRTSGYSSVDQFLEKRSIFTDVGTIAIAANLIPCEWDRRLFPPRAPRRDHWYETLAALLDVGERNYLRNRVTIITFNYDRSLEHYIANLMLNRLRGARGATMWRHFNHVPMLHVHGKLGELGHAFDSSTGTVPFGSLLSPEVAHAAARRIRVIHQARPTTPEFVAARRALREASRIYFLGFGYNPVNIARLGIFSEVWSASKRAKCLVHGTSLGAALGERSYNTSSTAWQGVFSLTPERKQSAPLANLSRNVIVGKHRSIAQPAARQSVMNFAPIHN
jgi:hypothetical protein